jgi:xanthosine utilization system XapX-like protein
MLPSAYFGLEVAVVRVGFLIPLLEVVLVAPAVTELVVVLVGDMLVPTTKRAASQACSQS